MSRRRWQVLPVWMLEDAAPAAPDVTSIAPDEGFAAGGTAVTISGTGFTDATGATVGGNAITSFSAANDTTITGVTAAHAVGATDVVVTGPGGSDTLFGGFEFIADPVAPDLVSILPTSGINQGGTVVTLTGTDFTADMTPLFGLDNDNYQSAGDLTYISPTEFTCTSPSSTDIDPINGLLGFVADIKVTNGIGEDTLLNCYTYSAL